MKSGAYEYRIATWGTNDAERWVNDAAAEGWEPMALSNYMDNMGNGYTVLLRRPSPPDTQFSGPETKGNGGSA